jgi:hypothetical protein
MSKENRVVRNGELSSGLLGYNWLSSREELTMIVIRNVFRLKFGKAREAVALIKEGVAIQKRAGANFSARVSTDLTGPFYTVVLELTVPSLSAFETEAPRFMADKDFQAKYQKLVPLVESGSAKSSRLLSRAALFLCRCSLSGASAGPQPACTRADQGRGVIGITHTRAN